MKKKKSLIVRAALREIQRMNWTI